MNAFGFGHVMYTYLVVSLCIEGMLSSNDVAEILDQLICYFNNEYFIPSCQ